MQNTNLLVIFLTGLTTGGLTCLALQGGLLTSVLAKREEKLISSRGTKRRGNPEDNQEPTTSNLEQSSLPIVSFLTAKLFIHTLLGALLGLLGSAFVLSPITRGWLQIAIGVYLFGIAGNLLNLHPFFRYFVITPPKFLARLAKNESKSNSIFAPALLGLMTVLLPCATTQAMEIVAIGTGNPLYGAAIMFAFILGTSPTFLIFGFLLNKGSSTFQKYFPAVAATAMFGMSIYSINAGVGLMGSVYTIQNFVTAAVGAERTGPGTNSVLGDKVQTTTINVTNSGYTPKNITLKKGVPTILKLITSNVQSCSRSFTIPALNINKLLPVTGETTIEFTPKTTGPLAFSCSMGMYTGRFNIVN
ncbi:MAG: putative membrane protein [Microgenomates group bacterium GW2011_GWC1_44_37]|uniref:Putative membrane protein n=1 Tax=Candidatus Collierbacteria bacterium GW2011_GWB2_44_22 TaxID=1618387 RepID=A0A0G1HVB5_9BACT|nr:MAG: putative membrane protein [Candidatus Collierbacteria bacterium GW2011_GWA2_44_13]KKT51061.1 MAG: putative membrane protein [Candidatus Collierbacteria bacterium GW2011_GWB2_44_22]KKT62075.1 MAG: putative membrane protein [Candidatus Collierbacteria bacterium GW2011_GWD1_44_27]KKT64610.1 MAG: putative membrane protein [Candidatus Collierbacteria bacterium GW2011_GWC2_44_30]KKT68434.1 MAG: putative membrane protein [Microgenomates group bacterium GW2011_GWC1_44_37]KKT88047.1 MAG: putati